MFTLFVLMRISFYASYKRKQSYQINIVFASGKYFCQQMASDVKLRFW